jgi:monoamine oxidase
MGLLRSVSACGDPDEGGLRSVAIIGAGIAGLHCAYRLQQADPELYVRVFEASDRIGGRVFTARDMFPDGQVAELGGELIDSNHRFMHALAQEFELTLDDRMPPEGYAVDTWFALGKVVPESTIVDQFRAVAPSIAEAMADADEDDSNFERLDQTTLADFLDEHVPPARYAELHALLTAAYRGEFGLECEQQSALNLVYLIDADTPEPFRIFGESDERYHVHGGNDLITIGLAKALGESVQLGQRLVAAQSLPGRYRITLQGKDGTHELDFGHLVFALPFSVLRDVDLSKLALSEDKRAMIADLGYGTNAKIMGAFRARVWSTQHQASGSITSDLPLQQAWDTSIGQDGETGILTNFLGGERGLASKTGSAEERFVEILADLEQVFPGVEAAYIADSAVRMHWPSHKYTLGSYTCYRPGQWSYWTLEGMREGRVHFCGEHTSPEFQGWMEGGAETGGRVAKEILDDHRIQVPKELTELLDEDALLVGSESEARISALFPARASRLRTRAQGAAEWPARQGEKR